MATAGVARVYMPFDRGRWPDLASRVCKAGVLLWVPMTCFIRQSLAKSAPRIKVER